MFRRKEESFEFESESDTGNENAAVAAATGIDRADVSRQGESSENKPAVAAPAAPRPASLAHVPGAAPRAPMSSAAASPFRPAAAPVAAPAVVARPAAPVVSAPSVPHTPAVAGVTPPANISSKTGGKRILTVGNDILLKGEIATCDRLVIEGEVDAKLNDVHTVEIAETGSFRGKAEIEDAEISGVFEGDLVVRNRLTIYSTGKVRGNITFGEIEIERGGELTGTIAIVGQSPASKQKEKAA